MKRILKKVISAILGFLSLVGILCNVKAAEITAQEYALERGELGYYCVQKWDGNKWIYLTYNQTFYTDSENNKRIAYCLCPGLPGVGYVSGEKETYNVKVNEIVKDERVWRIIKNGYPYKSVEQLGLETEDDAYFATMQAINCVLRGYTLEQATQLYRPGQNAISGEKLEDIQRRGNKTLDAMFSLIDIGLNGNEKQKYISDIDIDISSTEFEKDVNGYYSRKFKVNSAEIDIYYEIAKISDFPVGSYVADMDGNSKTVFQNGESFKIMIPENSIKQDILGEIYVNEYIKNYPLLYGKSEIEGFQDFALCNDEYSEKDENVQMYEYVNCSKLVISKRDADSNKPIEGTKFEVANSVGEKSIVSTNKDGQIILTKQYPGEFIIKEIEPANGYKLDDETKQVELKYNEEKEITITNELIKGTVSIIKVDKDDNNIHLPGVKFQLKGVDNEYEQEAVTDENGKLIFENVLKGVYKITELETIEGYEKNNDEYIIEVDGDEEVEYIIENKKIEHKIEKELPKTGNNNMYKINLVISGLICVGCIIFFIKFLIK